MKIYKIKLSELRSLLNEQEDNQSVVFDPETIDLESLKSKINAPFFRASISRLGGYGRAILMMVVSLDPKEDWAYGILENSKYMRFSLNQNGELDQFTLSIHDKSTNRIRSIKKFRKTMVGSIDEMIAKINKYVDYTKKTIEQENTTKEPIREAKRGQKLYVIGEASGHGEPLVICVGFSIDLGDLEGLEGEYYINEYTLVQPIANSKYLRLFVNFKTNEAILTDENADGNGFDPIGGFEQNDIIRNKAEWDKFKVNLIGDEDSDSKYDKKRERVIKEPRQKIVVVMDQISKDLMKMGFQNELKDSGESWTNTGKYFQMTLFFNQDKFSQNGVDKVIDYFIKNKFSKTRGQNGFHKNIGDVHIGVWTTQLYSLKTHKQINAYHIIVVGQAKIKEKEK